MKQLNLQESIDITKESIRINKQKGNANAAYQEGLHLVELEEGLTIMQFKRTLVYIKPSIKNRWDHRAKIKEQVYNGNTKGTIISMLDIIHDWLLVIKA